MSIVFLSFTVAVKCKKSNFIYRDDSLVVIRAKLGDLSRRVGAGPDAAVAVAGVAAVQAGHVLVDRFRLPDLL